MATKKSFTLQKFTNNRRMIVSFMIVVIMVAFILTFAKPAAMFSKMLKSAGIDAAPEDIRAVATSITLIGVGVTMMLVAASFASVPVVGAGLVLVGATLAVWGAIKIWNWNRSRKPNPVVMDKAA